MPGGFRPFRNGADTSDQGTIKRQGGTFGR
jgi:hypothetical protein